jgi:hypothetical protein
LTFGDRLRNLVLEGEGLDASLTDLDALILKVRDPKARAYVREATVAYRSGAYKAAVINTWVAVSFDIIIKIRELAQAGDAAARAYIEDFDRARIAHNVERLLKLEGKLIQQAVSPFGFLSVQDAVQMRRLEDDRNTCAHPSFSSEAELFQPSPELVRMHIVQAVEMLLANPPTQGRAMINAFASDLASTARSQADVSISPTGRSLKIRRGVAKGGAAGVTDSSQ